MKQETLKALADGSNVLTAGTGVTSSAYALAEAFNFVNTNAAGIGVEGQALTFDRFFADEDAAITNNTVRIMSLGDSMRVKWVFVAGGSTGDYTFELQITAHS